MSSSRRHPSRRAIALLVACGALAGCGFRPLYGTGDQTAEFDEELASIQVMPISERMGQILANSLRDNLNPSGAKVPKRYSLNVVLITSTGDYVIRKDGTASRELFVAYGNFSLTPVGAGSSVLNGTVRINDSYDVGESPYSVIVSNSDAQKRAAQEMSIDIRTRIAAYLRRQAKS
jgi:LPS-assembly lipoprotein